MKKLYLSAPEKIFSNVLGIKGLGIEELMPPSFVDRPGGTDTFLFMQFHDPVDVFLGTEIQRCPAKTTVVWEPHTRHYFGNAKRRWNHSWMLCSGEGVARTIRSSRVPLNSVLTADCDALMLKHLNAIYEEMFHFITPDMIILEGIFGLFIREIARAVRPRGQQQPIPAPLRQLMQEIEADLRRVWRLDELAARVHLSPSHFSATFKRYYSLSPIDYLLRLRMKRAAWLLEDRNFAVNEAATAVGFDDALYFSKAFKRQFGLSPRNYRAKMDQQCGGATWSD